MKKKSLALKAHQKDKEIDSDSESSSTEEDSSEFVMFTRKFRKFLKKEDKNFKRTPFMNKKSLKTYSNPIKKYDKVVCYNCRKSRHIQAECSETSRVRPSKLRGKKTKPVQNDHVLAAAHYCDGLFQYK